MASKKELQRLKRPDYFQTKMMAYLDRLQQHRNMILSLVGVIILTVVAVFAWQYYQDGQTQKRLSDLYVVDKMFEKELKQVYDQRESLSKEIEELKTKKAALETTADKKEANKKSIETIQISIDDKQSRLEALKPDHTASIAAYTSFYETYQKNPEGWRAGVAAVNQYIEMKDFEKAEAILVKILTVTVGQPFYQVQLRSLYISILEELQKYEDALVQVGLLNQAIRDDELKPRVLLLRGRLLAQSGKKEEAIKIFDEIITNYKSSKELQKARAFKAIVNG